MCARSGKRLECSLSLAAYESRDGIERIEIDVKIMAPACVLTESREFALEQCFVTRWQYRLDFSERGPGFTHGDSKMMKVFVIGVLLYAFGVCFHLAQLPTGKAFQCDVGAYLAVVERECRRGRGGTKSRFCGGRIKGRHVFGRSN